MVAIYSNELPSRRIEIDWALARLMVREIALLRALAQLVLIRVLLRSGRTCFAPWLGFPAGHAHRQLLLWKEG